MYCRTADGLLSPTYAVYKAENLWDTRHSTLCNGGPKGSQLIKIEVI